MLNAPQAVGFVIIYAFYLVIFFVGPDFIVPTQGADAQTVRDIALDIHDVTDQSGGYYYTALLLSLLPAGLESLIVITISALFIYIAVKSARSPLGIAIVAFLCISPILLFLFAFVKDTLIPIVAALSLLALRSNRGSLFKAVTVAAIYLGYGALFRQYYILIFAVFALLVISFRLRALGNVMLFCGVIAAALLIPDWYFQELGEARDIVNRGRQWSNFAGSRSAFMNLVPTRDAFDFLVNYFYAVLRLNLPILFNPAPQEVFLMLNVGIYGWLAYIGCSVRDPAVRFPVVLFISHVLVLTIFEPDLGSYLRHLSSVLIYLLPALSFWDWQRMPQHRPRRLGVSGPRSPKRTAGFR